MEASPQIVGLRTACAALGCGIAVAIGVLAAADGGFFPVAWGGLSLVLLWILGVATVLPAGVRIGRAEEVMLLSLLCLVGWTGVSSLWSDDVPRSVLDAERSMLYLVAFAGLVLLARRGAEGAMLAGITAACVGVALWSLATAARHGLPLSQPLGYSNAVGLLLGMGAICAAGLASHAARGARRILATAAVAVLLAATLLSGSGGALAAVAIGFAVATALVHGRRRAAQVAAAFAGCAVLAIVAGMAPPVVEARLSYWAVAQDAFGRAPLHGHGAGTFARTWLEHRPGPHDVQSAHSLYVETLAELGAVGLVLLLAALAAPAAALAGARGQPLPAAAAGAYSAFLVQAGFDWTWDMPVLVLTALCCASALLVGGRRHAPLRRPGRPVRALVLTGVLCLGAFAYAGVVGNAATKRSAEAARIGAFSSARLQAREALRWAPWSAEPLMIVGEAALRRGETRLARASFERGLGRDPRDWRLWDGLARASSGPARSSAAARARKLNPLGSRATRHAG